MTSANKKLWNNPTAGRNSESKAVREIGAQRLGTYIIGKENRMVCLHLCGCVCAVHVLIVCASLCACVCVYIKTLIVCAKYPDFDREYNMLIQFLIDYS